MTEASRDTGRRIGVLIDRLGRVEHVVVGDAHRVFLPDLGAPRAGASRFRGVRLVLTSLRPEGLTEDDLTDLALLQLDAVATVRVLPDGLPGEIEYATLLPPSGEPHRRAGARDALWQIEKVRSVHQWDDDWLALITDLEAQFARVRQLQAVDGRERAILIAVTTTGEAVKAKRGLRELGRLADTAGLDGRRPGACSGAASSTGAP